jgi:hypothetical protein
LSAIFIFRIHLRLQSNPHPAAKDYSAKISPALTAIKGATSGSATSDKFFAAMGSGYSENWRNWHSFFDLYQVMLGGGLESFTGGDSVTWDESRGNVQWLHGSCGGVLLELSIPTGRSSFRYS